MSDETIYKYGDTRIDVGTLTGDLRVFDKGDLMAVVDDGGYVHEAIERLREALAASEEREAGLTAEVAAHRKYLESITDNGSDYPETMDELIDLGLVVEAPPTPEFIDEWGDDCKMYVLAWSPLARRALDEEEVSDE